MENSFLSVLMSRLTGDDHIDSWKERGASVAIIFEEGPRLEMLMIRRVERDGDPWSGQIAFPGGKRNAEDRSPVETAIREAREEVGIDLATTAELLGYLRPLMTHTAAMTVVPCVFLLHRKVSVRLNSEVSSYRWVPLEAFLANRSRTTHLQRKGDGGEAGTAYRYGDYVIWGLTYKMISSLLGK